MLMDQLKERIKSAMKAGNTLERDVFKVALGDLQLQETRQGQPLTDEDVQKGLRKVIKGNREMISAVTDPAVLERMNAEIQILETLLPTTLDPAQIRVVLDAVAEPIRAAGNDGQATGIAMKHLKAQGLAVEGRDVQTVVKQLRE